MAVLDALLEGFDEAAHPRGFHGRWVRGHGGKPGRIEGTYNGVKLERGVAYQGRLATGAIHTGTWNGKITGRGVNDPNAHPEFRHVDTGAVRTFQGGEFFGKLKDVKPKLREAADSMAKASTPEPFSKSKTSNWVARAGGLPPYVQHIAHDLLETGRKKTESEAIKLAIAIVENPPKNWGDAARAAAAKAAAQWRAMRAKTGGPKAALQHSAGGYSIMDVLALRDAALERIAVLEGQFGLDGLPGLLFEGALAEAAAPAWAPTLKRTASASSELERHEVHDGSGQHVGSISRRKSYGRGEPDRFAAHAVNGERVTDYSGGSHAQALDALRKHLEEAPARVGKHSSGKWLVARPASYSGPDTFAGYPTESSARFAAGLPEKPSVPEQGSQVQKLGEMLRFDLMTVSGIDIPPLRRVQEARRADPFELAEGFSPGELRDFHGRWRGGGHHANLTPAGVSPGRPRGRRPQSSAAARYEGGVVRASARARQEHARRPQIAPDDLGGSVGKGSWSTAADKAAKAIAGNAERDHAKRSGASKDTEHAHRVVGPDGKLGKYTAERHALHQEIVRKLFQGKAEHPGRAKAIFMAGGPASGKSSLVDSGKLRLPGDVAHVNPDVVREMLPEYKQLLDAGREDASALTHEEASHVSKLAMAYALKMQHHVLVDTVGDSEPGKFVGKLHDAKMAGHEVSVHYATLPVPLAMKLAKIRAQKTGRHVPEQYLRDAHRDVSTRFMHDVSKVHGVHIQVFDTELKDNPRLVAEKRAHDNLRIVNRDGFVRFLKKGGG